MGLKTGQTKLLEVLSAGLYNRNAHNYSIYVDGDIIRYKGMTSSNIMSHNACEAIANTAFEYMMSVLCNIETMFSSKPKEIIVYMKRYVQSLPTTSTQIRTMNDIRLIRDIFKGKCILNNFKIYDDATTVQLYHKRDRTNCLNIFVTSDSIMIPLTYDHQAIKNSTDCQKNTTKTDATDHDDDVGNTVSNPLATRTIPKIFQIATIRRTGEKISPKNIKSVSSTKPMTPTTTTETTKNTIENRNNFYAEECEILDSCLWINNTNLCITAIGCDFNAEKMRYNHLAFLTFCSMCGTAFTPNILTESMIASILKASDTDVAFVNTLTDVKLLIYAFIYLGVKNGGILKPFLTRRLFVTPDDDDDNDNDDNVNINRYTEATTINTEQMRKNVLNCIKTAASRKTNLNLLQYSINIRHYINYIKTGSMDQFKFYYIHVQLLCRNILIDLGYSSCNSTRFKKNSLYTWANAKSNTIDKIFNNL